MNKSKSQEGFSLVGVLIIMGVVLVSMLLISQARFKQKSVQKAIQVKGSYSDVNQALINAVVDQFHKGLLTVPVAGGFTCPTADIITTGGLLNGKNAYAVKTPPVINGNAPLVHTQAITRCSNAVTPSGNGNRYYFCLQISPDTSADKDSILNAEKAFAEFAIELIDLQTNLAISCQEYSKRANDMGPPPSLTHVDGSAGMAVTMALYWENKSGVKDSIFSQKALSYIANQN